MHKIYSQTNLADGSLLRVMSKYVPAEVYRKQGSRVDDRLRSRSDDDSKKFRKARDLEIRAS